MIVMNISVHIMKMTTLLMMYVPQFKKHFGDAV